MAGRFKRNESARIAQSVVVQPSAGKTPKAAPSARLSAIFSGVTPCFSRSMIGCKTRSLKSPGLIEPLGVRAPERSTQSTTSSHGDGSRPAPPVLLIRETRRSVYNLWTLVARIAVIGSGISGLAAAYYLSRKHEVLLFERDSRIGGHTHTVTVDSSRGPLHIDTGFIVHNDRTYPNLIQLFTELGIPRANSDMSFAVSCRRSGYEYSSRGLQGFFAQRRNMLFRPAYRLFGEIRRFNRHAPLFLARPDAGHVKLSDFLDEHRYSEEFRQLYLFPMTSAVWSCAPAAAREFPAAMLIRFFDNHNFLTMTR